MSDGPAASPALHSAEAAQVAFESAHAGMPLEDASDAPDAPQPLMAASPVNTLSKPASHHNLAQQMQVFLTRTDIAQSRKNRFYLQQVFELLSELDQHTARRGQLQTSLQETEAHIQRIRHSLVEIAGDSVDAENEALAIAQARAHLAGLLRDKIVQTFE